MKAKTIKAVLHQKINEWIGTIEDDLLREEVKENCIVTGGAIVSMLLNENVNDYDVYFTNKETTKRVAEYYVNQFKGFGLPTGFSLTSPKPQISVVETDERIKIKVKSQGVVSEDLTNLEITSDTFIENVTDVLRKDEKSKRGQATSDDYRPIFLSSNAITLSGGVQLIIRFYGSPEEIHRNYDFVHCTNYWVSGTDELVLRPEALESLITKSLVYVGSRYPLASIIRTRKFIQRGFSCNAGQFLKMCWQVSKLDLNDINVLEDQLVGVDAAYFQILVDVLKAEREKSSKFSYDYAYVAELIDKIF